LTTTADATLDLSEEDNVGINSFYKPKLTLKRQSDDDFDTETDSKKDFRANRENSGKNVLSVVTDIDIEYGSMQQKCNKFLQSIRCCGKASTVCFFFNHYDH
jgi:hypothetical protein